MKNLVKGPLLMLVAAYFLMNSLTGCYRWYVDTGLRESQYTWVDVKVLSFEEQRSWGLWGSYVSSYTLTLEGCKAKASCENVHKDLPDILRIKRVGEKLGNFKEGKMQIRKADSISWKNAEQTIDYVGLSYSNGTELFSSLDTKVTRKSAAPFLGIRTVLGIVFLFPVLIYSSKQTRAWLKPGEKSGAGLANNEGSSKSAGV